MATNKRQHTVTKSYLRGFTASMDTLKICQYAKTDGSSREIDVGNATIGKYIYSFKRSDGTWNHAVEESLERVESDGMPVLGKLIQDERISSDERLKLSLFLATMVRRPRPVMEHFLQIAREFANDKSRMMSWLDEIRPKLEANFTADEIAETEQRIREGKLDLSDDPVKAGQFRAWSDTLPSHAPIISSMYWQVWTAQKGFEFVTSDAPAYVRREKDDSDKGIVGIARADLGAELNFPLSKTSFLVAKHSPCCERMKASKSRVRELNAKTIRMAHEFVFSPTHSDTIVDLILANRGFMPPLPNIG